MSSLQLNVKAAYLCPSVCVRVHVYLRPRLEGGCFFQEGMSHQLGSLSKMSKHSPCQSKYVTSQPGVSPGNTVGYYTVSVCIV